jgi:hypothetical protein
MNDITKTIVAAANSPIRQILTTVFSGVIMALLLWMTNVLVNVSHTLPLIERRISTLEMKQDSVTEHLALSREAIAVLRREVAMVQEELRTIRANRNTGG